MASQVACFFSPHRLLSLLRTEGLINGATRALQSIAAKIRGRVFLNSWERTCGPGMRLIGKRFVHFEGQASFGWFCRIEAYEFYRGRKYKPRIRIGSGAHFSDFLHIGAIGEVEIGEDVLFGSKILVIDHDHGSYSGPSSSKPSTKPIERELHSRGKITIGNRVWVGEGAVILGGTSIGAGSVIGAGAVVSGDVPAETVVIGSSGRIKRFDHSSGRWVRAEV